MMMKMRGELMAGHRTTHCFLHVLHFALEASDRWPAPTPPPDHLSRVEPDLCRGKERGREGRALSFLLCPCVCGGGGGVGMNAVNAGLGGPNHDAEAEDSDDEDGGCAEVDEVVDELPNNCEGDGRKG